MSELNAHSWRERISADVEAPASVPALRAHGTGQRGLPMRRQDDAPRYQRARTPADQVMQATLAALPEPDSEAPTIIVDGNAANIRVVNGHLQIDDRSKEQPRSLRLVRAYSRGKRIVVLAWHGMLSFDAIQWCQALDIQLVLVDPRMQNIILHGGKTYDDPRLRRAQAIAPTSADGLEVTRYLLTLKLHGQRTNLAQLGYVSNDIDHACKTIDQAETINICRQLESSTAASYWECLSQTTCTFRPQDQRRVPAHWIGPGSRYSPKTKSPKNAVTPFNAILNYLYKLAEAEVSIALRAVGLDPGLGIVHTDRPGRDSMTLDALEAIRPDVERHALRLVQDRVFGKQDFMELPDGTCRLLPPITHELAQTMPLWRSAIGPVVEHVANLLRPATRTGQRVVRTQLTNANIRASLVKMRDQRIGTTATAEVGSRVEADGPADRAPEQRAEADDPADRATPLSWGEILAVVQSASTERLVAVTGLSHRYIRRVKRGEKTPKIDHWQKLYHAATNGTNVATKAASDAVTPPVVANTDPASLSWNMLRPLVQRTPTAQLATATGLTPDYIRKIKRGIYQPHERHWLALSRAIHDQDR
jgi:CRISPR-associated endonuclease Cas1